MLVFIIPLIPSNLRTELRDTLWKLCKASLVGQININWKAIIIGNDIFKNEFNNENLIHIEGDLYTKKEKLNMALKKIDVLFKLKPQYIMRLDCDDIISPSFLDQFYALRSNVDLYCDKYHVCIDPVYMSISYRNANWIANTAVHKYEHAIVNYGPDNEALFVIDHAVYWKRYYSDKRIVYANKHQTIYYRILSPFSISSTNSKKMYKEEIRDYDYYLKGFGPWVALKKNFFMYTEIQEVYEMLKTHKHGRTILFNLFNYAKYFMNIIFFKKIKT